ncbi:hypothetical protein SLS55_002088 [Diplodia seriata]|uniref:5'-3' DNA helicase ZGRF1-like N-terminal domain-containing protein n=1 Tax=Diplodia seriata TaxID=420778 RepID=A0ABR3CR76_9PEZI
MSTVRGTIRSTAQSSTAANTAPVHEFRCLYTHDLRRKQKRWQDGFLKFHTFNKRVMVYDQPRNYIGDTHWKGGDTLNDGDELTLENGVIVQVAEPVATTQTDLTELLQKKPRDVQQFPAPANEDFELMEKTIADTEEQPVEEEAPKHSKKLRLATGDLLHPNRNPKS